MAKIENVTEKAPRRRYEVVVSFDGLNRGDVFEDHGDPRWARQRVESGYLRELTGEEPGVERSDVGQG